MNEVFLNNYFTCASKDFVGIINKVLFEILAGS